MLGLKLIHVGKGGWSMGLVKHQTDVHEFTADAVGTISPVTNTYTAGHGWGIFCFKGMN